MPRQLTQRPFSLLLSVVVFLPILLAMSSDSSSNAVTVATHPLTISAADQAGPGDYQSEVIVAPFTMIGVTWTGTGPSEIWFRVDGVDGPWTAWEALEVSDAETPDPGTAEADRQHRGSEPLYVGSKGRIQFRFPGGGYSDLEAVLIDGTAAEAAPVAEFSEQLSTDLSGSIPGQPAIRPRSDWDPYSQCPPRETPEEIQPEIAIIHHTGIHNSYTESAVPGILLGYCLYHRNTRGFDDIAYNLLVDRFGTIWEGRAGGIDRAIRGGHAAGFSSYSTGIALIGNYTSSSVGWRQRSALEQLLAWKLGIHNIDPLAVAEVISMGSDKYDEGVPVTLNAISGHRDVKYTACPGIYAYNALPDIRSSVAAVWRAPAPDFYDHPVVGDLDGDGDEEGLVYRRSDGSWWLHDGGASALALDGPDGGVVDGSISVDLDGDGSDEIVVRSGASVKIIDASGGVLVSSGGGSLGSAGDWAMHSVDVDADGREEVAFVDGAGTVRILDEGSVAAWGSIGPGHESTMAGDFDGDGRDDLAGMRSTGVVDVALSTGSGFGSATRWGDAGPDGAWVFALAGDLDGDGDDDVAAYRSSDETWYALRSTGTALANMRPVATPTLAHWSEAFVYDYENDGVAEVVALNAYAGTWHIGRFDGVSPHFTTLEDSPYRTTVQRNASGMGTSFLSWYGREFSWIKTDLGYGVGGEADATDRLYGASRYDTAARVSADSFAAADVVFVGTGEKYPDALTGGAAASLLGVPMLITAPTSLPASTRAEIQRLGPDQIVLLGGTAAVAATVEAQLAALAPNGVVRIGGADRYETAALVSRRFYTPGVETVYVATGMNFPDALAGVPGADRVGAPILLTRTDSVPAPTMAEIDRLAPSEIVILGGPVAVSERVAAELSGHAPVVRRLAGSDRYATAAAISREAFPAGAEIAYLVIGTNFPDAVASGPAAALSGGPLLLTHGEVMSGYTLAELRRLRPSRIVVVGSESLITAETLDALEGIGIGGLTMRVSELPRP